jgi:hypothetical protein
MAAYINVTNKFLNQDKRYSEGVVMTCPAIIDEGSARAGQGPTYITSGDAWTGAVVEPDTIVKKAYLIVDEAFPAGATLSVDIAGTAYFVDVPADATGITVSTIEDGYFANGQTITVGIVAGSAGSDVVSGVARVVLDTVHPSLKNGQYAVS